MFEDDIQVVNIEVTSHCNLSCLYCSKNKFGYTRTPAHMDTELFVQILEMFPKRVLLALYLSGEPLLHPSFCELVSLAKQKGFNNTRIHTNATVLDTKLSEKLVDSGLRDIVFSIDGINAKDYERMRNFSFDKVKSNIKEFIDINQGEIKIGVQCLIPKGMPLRLNTDLEDLSFDFSIIEYPHTWLNYQIPESEPSSMRSIPCLFLSSYMAISCEGDYLLCCCCLNKERVLGKFWNTSAKDIWENEMELIRHHQRNGYYVDTCSTCERYGITKRG